MGIATALNAGFTMASMNPKRLNKSLVKPESENQRIGRLAKALKLDTDGTVIVPVPDPWACSLEHQCGMFRAFIRASGGLLHSHECKSEVVRRAHRDGYHFA